MKLKNLSYPALLMAIVAVTELISTFTTMRYLVSPSFVVIIRIIITAILEPAVFFVLLAVLNKNKDKKVIAIASLVLCALSFRDLANSASLLTSGEFIDVLVNGYANSVLFALFKTAMLAILGISLISDKKMTGLYNVVFYLGAFLVLYGSVIMSIANPAAIITNLSDFLFLLALWYIPRFFDESKIATTATSKKKIKFLVILVAAMYALLFFAGGIANSCSGSSSSSSSSINKNGFVGSDGKYHAYVPEFGDDVNNWMAENW
ncbi:MAG: hypothetical protein IKY78_02030 [Clostridia bacterium]|nr:hypothetical protein [Clostridia bacterium]